MYVMYSGCGCARTADSSQPPALEIVPGSGWIVQTEERLAALEIAGKQARVLEETERSRVSRPASCLRDTRCKSSLHDFVAERNVHIADIPCICHCAVAAVHSH